MFSIGTIIILSVLVVLFCACVAALVLVGAYMGSEQEIEEWKRKQG